MADTLEISETPGLLRQKLVLVERRLADMEARFSRTDHPMREVLLGRQTDNALWKERVSVAGVPEDWTDARLCNNASDPSALVRLDPYLMGADAGTQILMLEVRDGNDHRYIPWLPYDGLPVKITGALGASGWYSGRRGYIDYGGIDTTTTHAFGLFCTFADHDDCAIMSYTEVGKSPGDHRIPNGEIMPATQTLRFTADGLPIVTVDYGRRDMRPALVTQVGGAQGTPTTWATYTYDCFNMDGGIYPGGPFKVCKPRDKGEVIVQPPLSLGVVTTTPSAVTLQDGSTSPAGVQLWDAGEARLTFECDPAGTIPASQVLHESTGETVERIMDQLVSSGQINDVAVLQYLDSL